MLRLNTPLTGLLYFAAATTANLNDLSKQGSYTGFGVTTTNAPNSNLATDFELDVTVNPSTGDVTQTLRTLQGVYTRTYTASSWGSWTAATVSAQNIQVAQFKKAAVAGGAAGNITITGIKTTDALLQVLYFPVSGGNVTGMQDLTSEFTITAADTINNTGGTATTGGRLLVNYCKRSA